MHSTHVYGNVAYTTEIFYTRDATTNIYFLFYFGKRMCRMYSDGFEQGLFRQLTFLASLSVSYFICMCGEYTFMATAAPIMPPCDVTRLIIRTVLRKTCEYRMPTLPLSLDHRRSANMVQIN